MIAYLAKLKSSTANLDHFEINLIPRCQNTQEDALAKLASSNFNDLERTVMVKILSHRSIDEEKQKEVNCVAVDYEWYYDILAHKVHGVLPTDKSEAQ